jgi:peptidoglycan hydrolase-like protein with peptidoglycan-binding domain
MKRPLGVSFRIAYTASTKAMGRMQCVIAGMCGSVALLVPLTFADALSLSVQSASPGTSVFANSKISFSIVASGFLPQSYQLSDSFSGSTISLSDIGGLGNFAWVPVSSDVGTHVLSIGATDNSGDVASTTETITVMPAPSVSVSSISPGSSIMPKTKLTFNVSTIGFTDPSFILSDSFSGSTVTDSDLDASDHFSWTPADISQDGEHTINVYAYDSLGHIGSINVPILVGPGPTLTIQSLSPGASVSPSQALSFTVNGSNFSPNSFSVSDNFPGTTLTEGDINTSGSFYWVPQMSDTGTHVLTIVGTVGVYGQSASTTQTILVLAPAGAAVSSTASTTVAATPVATVPASNLSGPAFTTSLYSGMQGTAVTELQTMLSGLGFFSQTPNGYFGPLTVAAVEKFQAAHGLQQLGVVGPATRAALNALLTGSQTTPSTSASAVTNSAYAFQDPIGFGESGTDVLELQKRLAALGFFSGQPTGYFGDATLEAVIQFQKAQGIQPVDQLGTTTRAALDQ